MSPPTLQQLASDNGLTSIQVAPTSPEVTEQQIADSVHSALNALAAGEFRHYEDPVLRESFEDWTRVSPRGWNLARVPDDCPCCLMRLRYRHDNVQCAWEAWQAVFLGAKSSVYFFKLWAEQAGWNTMQIAGIRQLHLNEMLFRDHSVQSAWEAWRGASELIKQEAL